MDFQQGRPQRRRSERVSKSLPIVVRGTDLLGQPFEERTATLNFNLHGCRYASRYHLPKNAWVTLEVPHGSEFENARARVAWIQRPHSVREFFQISVELEAPQNIWGVEPSPEDWAAVERAYIDLQGPTEAASESESPRGSESPSNSFDEPGKTMEEMDTISAAPESALEAPAVPRPDVAGNASNEGSSRADASAGPNNATEADRTGGPSSSTSAASKLQDAASPDSEPKAPWIRSDVFDDWKREFERLQGAARERLAGYQKELLGEIKGEFQQNLEQAKWLIGELEKSREALHAENDAAVESAGRLARERSVAAESAEPRGAASLPAQFVPEEAQAEWRRQISSEMDAARIQWDELLQSSLDAGVHRLAEKLSERAGEALQPLTDRVNAAQQTATEIEKTLEAELTRARASLAEIEHSAAQVSSLSGQIDSATSSALDELNRRLELVLNAQTEEMGERAERVTTRAATKAAAEIDAASRTTIADVAAQIESRLSPHYERVSELLRELSSREMQAEESLRLQRERLRQVSEASRREFLSQFDNVAAAARSDFDLARQTAAAHWSEEIEGSKAVASRAAAEAAQAASEAVENQSRTRLQAAADELLETSSLAFDEQAAEARRKFASDLESVSGESIAQIRGQIDTIANDVSNRSRTEMERAAEAAAAAFGQVLQDVSERRAASFDSSAAAIAEARKDELETSARRLLRNFETNAESSLARFHQQMTAQVETSIAEGRSALSSEFNSSLAAFRAQREAHERDRTENLERLNAESAARYEDRISTASDAWVLSSVRRLNEHGQGVVESLMRSADDAVRESCAKLFDGLAEILRERSSLSERHGRSEGARADAEAAAAPIPSDTDQPGL